MRTFRVHSSSTCNLELDVNRGRDVDGFSAGNIFTSLNFFGSKQKDVSWFVEVITSRII